jgi:capsular polysaccharide biosynthesis protein
VILSAPHGAGLVNLIFCQPGTVVLEFMYTEDYTSSSFYDLSSEMELEYWVVPIPNMKKSDNFEYPIQKTIRILERVLL